MLPFFDRRQRSILFYRITQLVLKIEMHLQSHILTAQSAELLKYLKQNFEHPYSVTSTSADNPHSSLKGWDINKWITSLTFGAHLLVGYNLSLDHLLCRKLSNGRDDWDIEIVHYDGMSGTTANHWKGKLGDLASYLSTCSGSHNPYSLQMTSEETIIRIYFLPHSEADSTTLSCSVHHIFKLLRVLHHYYTLDKHPESHNFVHEVLTANLNDYLYTYKVASVTLLLNAPEERVLQQVGSLALPQPWLDKPQYRDIKREIYFVRREQELLARQFRYKKHQVTETVNALGSLVGYPPLEYKDVSIETFKRLRSEGLAAKTTEVIELDKAIKAIELRRRNLALKLQELTVQQQHLQQQQCTQMLQLKTQVLKIQSGSSNKLNAQSKMSKTSPHKLISTIFSRTLRNAASDDPYKKLTKQKILQVEKQASQTEQFQKVEKKVAAIVKHSPNGASGQFDADVVRAERQDTFLSADFNAERTLQTKLANYKKAGLVLFNLIQQAEDVNLHYFQS